MADAGRPSSMSSHKLRRLAATGQGEQLLPRLFETRDQSAPQPRHVITIDDVTRGLGVDAPTAERVARVVVGTNVSFSTQGGSQRLVDGRGRLVEFLREQGVNSDVRQEIEKRALAFWRRTQKTDLQKEPKMRFVLKAELGESTLEKAGGHKYLRREPDGRGGWRYFYHVKADRKEGHGAERAEIKEGDRAGKHGKFDKITHDGDFTHFEIGDYGMNNKHPDRTHHISTDGDKWTMRTISHGRDRGTNDREHRSIDPESVHHLFKPQSGYEKTSFTKKERAKQAAQRGDAPKVPKKIPKEGIEHPGDPGEGKIWIVTSGGPEKVDAQKFGNFAVHKQEHSEITGHGGIDKAPKTRTHSSYTITHIPTGLRLHSSGVKLEAQRYARHMQEHANDALAGAKFGKTDYSNMPTSLRQMQDHHNNAVEAATYKSAGAEVITLLKASGHKYTTRAPDGKGGWRYSYQTTPKPQKVSHEAGPDKAEWDPHAGKGHVVVNGAKHELISHAEGVAVRAKSGGHSWESKHHYVGPANMTGSQLHEAAKHALSKHADNVKPARGQSVHAVVHKEGDRHHYRVVSGNQIHTQPRSYESAEAAAHVAKEHAGNIAQKEGKKGSVRISHHSSKSAADEHIKLHASPKYQA